MKYWIDTLALKISLIFNVITCTAVLAALQQKRMWRTPASLYVHHDSGAALLRGKRTKAMLASIARLLHAWTRASAVRRELSHLSDRELADIGITRSDIERIIANHVHD